MINGRFTFGVNVTGPTSGARGGPNLAEQGLPAKPVLNTERQRRGRQKGSLASMLEGTTPIISFERGHRTRTLIRRQRRSRPETVGLQGSPCFPKRPPSSARLAKITNATPRIGGLKSVIACGHQTREVYAERHLNRSPDHLRPTPTRGAFFLLVSQRLSKKRPVRSHRGGQYARGMSRVVGNNWN